MSHITPLLTSLIAAVKKSTMSLNRDFAEIQSLQTSINGAKNFTTLSIKKVEECLVAELKYLKPDLPIYKNADSIKTDNCFLVNIADNFSNFNKGLDFCGVTILLIEAGKPFASVIYNPATKTMYFAQSGKGAFMEGFRNHERLRVSGQKDPKQTVIATDAKYFAKVSKITEDARILGSTIMNFIYCAQGKFDALLLSKIDLCTLAAGTLFVKESGGYSFAPAQTDFRAQDFDLIFKNKNVLITNINLNKTLPELLK